MRVAFLALAFGAALLVLADGGAAPARADGTLAVPTAEAIFSRAREALVHETCPARIDYMISVEATVAGRRERNRFRAHYLVADDVLAVAALSDEEMQHPVEPHGANIVVSLALGFPPIPIPFAGASEALTRAVHPHDTPAELLGIPKLEPTYAFGLMKRSTPQSSPDPSAAPNLPVIGSTGTISREYTVALAALEATDVGRVYDLSLTPLRNPTRNRIREMWVDAQTFAVDQIRTAGNFRDGPPTRVGWLITYARAGGCELIDEERALDTLHYGPKRTYEETTIAFTVEPTSRYPVFRLTMPPWYDVLEEPEF